MNNDILWTTKHMETAKMNIRGMVGRMRENGKIAAFVVYTPQRRLFWFPANTAIGYAGEGDRKGTAFLDEDTLCFVDNIAKNGEFELNAITPVPKNQKELVESIFSFLKNKCGLDQMEVRQSCRTAEKLDSQSVEAVDEGKFDDGMDSVCTPA